MLILPAHILSTTLSQHTLEEKSIQRSTRNNGARIRVLLLSDNMNEYNMPTKFYFGFRPGFKCRMIAIE
jgi:hypothetical protein